MGRRHCGWSGSTRCGRTISAAAEGGAIPGGAGSAGPADNVGERRHVGGARFADDAEGAVRFQDNGGGIPSSVLSNVFTPFFTTKNEGTGLGLSIVDRIVREHGGLVDIRTGEGEGTCVSVRFPVFTPAAERAERPAIGVVRAAEVVCDV